jgi:hypothetical protein
MAYQTGTYTGSNDLLDKFRLFAIAQGWTVNNYAIEGTGYALSIQKTISTLTHYYNLRSSTAEQIFLGSGSFTGISSMPSTGYNSSATAWYDHTGARYTLSTYPTSGGGYIKNTSGTDNYHFFSQSNSLSMAVIDSNDEFQGIALGNCNSIGHMCRYGSVVGTSSQTGRFASWSDTDTKELSAFQAYIGGAFRFGMSLFSGNTSSSSVISPPYVRNDSVPSAQYALKQYSPDGFRGNPVLADSECLTQASSTGEWRPTGSTAGISFLNGSLIVNEQEIVLGSDTYVCFRNASDNSEGVAFLK